MESLELTQFGNVYRGRRVLVTGHTGFKGSWLALWLTELGADVTGCSLAPPTSPNHWDLLGLQIADHRLDVRDASAIARVVSQVRPEVVFHLAAQSLVRRSYREPLETWSTNVMGTANVLDACRQTAGVRAVVVVTSDKCYENQGWKRGYREDDRLGGHDPYSASKAATEMVAASYRGAFFGSKSTPLLATGRAGNVIGGGDWSEDRLLPDVVRAIAEGSTLEIRSPQATRPWQHVLEPLSAYLLLGQKLLEGRGECEGGWNFGPLQRTTARWPKSSSVCASCGPDWRGNKHSNPSHTRRTCFISTAGKLIRSLAGNPFGRLKPRFAPLQIGTDSTTRTDARTADYR